MQKNLHFFFFIMVGVFSTYGGNRQVTTPAATEDNTQAAEIIKTDTTYTETEARYIDFVQNFDTKTFVKSYTDAINNADLNLLDPYYMQEAEYKRMVQDVLDADKEACLNTEEKFDQSYFKNQLFNVVLNKTKIKSIVNTKNISFEGCAQVPFIKMNFDVVYERDNEENNIGILIILWKSYSGKFRVYAQVGNFFKV